MKAVIVALVVLVVINQGESLICKCAGPFGPCESPVETCGPEQTVCGNLIMNGWPGFFFQGCIDPVKCYGQNNPPSTSTFCCTEDMCNAADGIMSTT